jgi:Tfp pilus assembly protein PilX
MTGDVMFVRLSSALRARVRGDDRDGGIAMIMVLGTIIVLTALVTAALGYAMQVQPQARKDQDWNAALSAAQAGVDDYVAKLNGLDSYWGPLPFADCANTAMAGPAVGENTCGWTSTTAVGWRDVQLGNAKAGKFHYDVDPSIIYSQGAVRLSSTGKVGKSSRTIQVNVSRGGPTAFLYYTDFEDADPGNTTAHDRIRPIRGRYRQLRQERFDQGRLLVDEGHDTRSGGEQWQRRTQRFLLGDHFHHRGHPRRRRSLQRHPADQR